MSDPIKMDNQEPVETDKSKKTQITADELEKVTGGANFWFFDDERRKPKDDKRSKDRSNGG